MRDTRRAWPTLAYGQMSRPARGYFVFDGGEGVLMPMNIRE